MHRVPRQVLGFDGLKRSRADMECDVRDRDAGARKGIEHRAVEVQSGRRRGRRARMARVQGLIARSVGGVGGTADIRGQRHFTVALQIVEEGSGALQAQTDERPSRSMTVASALAGSSSTPPG